MQFLIFSGSLRQGQYTQYVAQFVLEQANQKGRGEFELIDPRQLGLTFQDEGRAACPPALRAQVAAADGYLIVAPEYNHGYSGSLKYVLDLNQEEYLHKPVAFVSLSTGPFGGTRMIETLVGVVRELGMVACREDLNIGNITKEVIDGRFQEPAKWTPRLERVLDEFFWLAQVLADGRANVPTLAK